MSDKPQEIEPTMGYNSSSEETNAVDNPDWEGMAESLWALLDDIDTAGDMFKPGDIKSWEAHFKYITMKHNKRFEIMSSDGYKLFPLVPMDGNLP